MREREVVALGGHRQVREWVALGDGDGGGAVCIGCGLLNAAGVPFGWRAAWDGECVERWLVQLHGGAARGAIQAGYRDLAVAWSGARCAGCPSGMALPGLSRRQRPSRASRLRRWPGGHP